MSSSIKVFVGALLIVSLSPATTFAYEAPTEPAARPFNYASDTFSFANETVWNYFNGSVQPDSSRTKSEKRDYTRRCFVVTRAAVQFWKFARFDPLGPPLEPPQLADRIRTVTERSVWLPSLPEKEKIVIPGYASLRDISASDPALFQANIGLGWPVYFRAGNMPIIVPVSRGTEARLNDEVFHDLHMNWPTIVWLYNFPSLSINHVVVVISGRRDGNLYRYRVYDPNYANGPKELDYDPTTRTFTYNPTFYFKGGTVEARAIYRGVLQ